MKIKPTLPPAQPRHDASETGFAAFEAGDGHERRAGAGMRRAVFAAAVFVVVVVGAVLLSR